MTAAPSATAVRPARIMILEDDMLNALLLEDTLQFAGHQVVGSAKTIPSALGLLNTRSFDAAIIDLQIDDEVSFDVGRRLEQLHVPWGITTAHPPSFVPPEFAHVPLLIKPFAVTALMGLVDDLLIERGSHAH